MAARNIKSGEVMLSIPEQLMIISEKLLGDLQGFVVANNVFPQTLPIWQHIMLELFLIEEK